MLTVERSQRCFVVVVAVVVVVVVVVVVSVVVVVAVVVAILAIGAERINGVSYPRFSSTVAAAVVVENEPTALRWALFVYSYALVWGCSMDWSKLGEVLLL